MQFKAMLWIGSRSRSGSKDRKKQSKTEKKTGKMNFLLLKIKSELLK